MRYIYTVLFFASMIFAVLQANTFAPNFTPAEYIPYIPVGLVLAIALVCILTKDLFNRLCSGKAAVKELRSQQAEVQNSKVTTERKSAGEVTISPPPTSTQKTLDTTN